MNDAVIEKDATTALREERNARTVAAAGRMKAATADERVRISNAIVEDHLELADAIARRFRRDGEDYSDLRQVAMLGLVKAARRFDPERGTPFVPYAMPTIVGELKRHLRDHGWFVRPGRRLQELCGEVTSTRSQLAQTLGREPSDDDLAAETGATASEIREARACLAAQHPVAVDAEPGQDDRDATSVLPAVDDDSFERAEMRATLAAALHGLDDRSAYIVYRRFVDECTQAEIGRELGVTQMQISRLLAQILERMRVELDGPRDGSPSLAAAA